MRSRSISLHCGENSLMSEAAIVNASPIIYLSRTRYLDLLQLAAPEISIPRQVAEEIQARGSEDPAARAIAQTPWIRVVDVPKVPEKVLAWDLGPGDCGHRLGAGTPGLLGRHRRFGGAKMRGNAGDSTPRNARHSSSRPARGLDPRGTLRLGNLAHGWYVPFSEAHGSGAGGNRGMRKSRRERTVRGGSTGRQIGASRPGSSQRGWHFLSTTSSLGSSTESGS